MMRPFQLELIVFFLVLVPFVPARAGNEKTGGHWRFEGKVNTSASGKVLASLREEKGLEGKGFTEGNARLTFSAEVAGPYVYDPRTGKSYKNKTSLRFQPGTGRAHVKIPLADSKEIASFTLELFVRPAAMFRKQAPIASLSAARKATPMAGLITDRGSTYTWLGAVHRPTKGRGQSWNVGYYLGSGRLTKREYWRHMALVYDARKKEFTYWLDHFQTDSRKPPVKLTWKDGVVYLGARPGSAGFDGHIDEVRFVPEALPRTEFLRARDTPAENVRFESKHVVMPRDAGYIDLKEAFGAAGDGRTDDTRAFREAFMHLANKQPLRDYFLYVPPGEYVISDEVRWTRFLFVQGAGRNKTIIRLKDNCPGYGDGQKPRGVLTVAWHDFTPKASGRAGNNIGSYLHDLTIDTGKGNPGAVGLAYHSNNHGSVTNVTIRSGDSKGWAGLSLADNWPGPSLIKNVTIQGFDKGIYSVVSQYSITFKDLVLEKQNEVGIYNRGQMLWIDGLRSNNQVPVLDDRGLVVLVNGLFTGGKKGETAIKMSGGYGLYRNIKIEGYRYAYRRKEKDGKVLVSEAPYIAEQVFGKVTHLFPAAKKSMALPLESPPTSGKEQADPRTWTNLLAYKDKVKEGDWAPAIQAAIDSGAHTLYVPNRVVLGVKSPVHVRKSVRHLVGFHSGVAAHKGYDGPVMIYDNKDPGHMLIVNRFRTGRLHHASPGTLVLRDTRTRYTNKPGAGKLFAEDVQGRYTITRQKAWFWQLNVEYDAPPGSARFENHGGQVVLVGMKTEKKGTNILTTNGGRTELLGGYFYPNAGTGGQPSIIINSASFSGTWRNYWARYDPVVRETRKGETRKGGERYQGLFLGFVRKDVPRYQLQPYKGR